MKKLLSLMTASCFALLVACGPSAEEKAAAEKARMDSIANVQAQMTADSLAQVEMEKARLDSMAMALKADSIAKAEAEAKKVASKPKVVAKPKPKTTLSNPETPKVGKKKPGAN